MEFTSLNKDSPQKVWLDSRALPSEDGLLWELIKHSVVDTLVVDAQQLPDLKLPQRTQLVVEVTTNGDFEKLAPKDIPLSKDCDLLDLAKRDGRKTCWSITIKDAESLEKACETATRYDFAVVDFDLPTNIPLELLIARLCSTNTVLLKREKSVQAARTAFGVLEHGCDGVVLSPRDSEEIKELSDHLAQSQRYQLTLHPLVVDEVRHIGMGARGCIDTTDLMTQSEGMLVGSTSGGGIFICSETHYLPYMNLRPFRVNAGAVHSYVWGADKNEYITDLSAGSKILCVNTKGEAREVLVGRVKIEIRPLLLIKGKVQNRELNVIVQDDWHIRVMGADGKPKNATLIRPGDELLAYLDTPGRHVGVQVDETIVEQ